MVLHQIGHHAGKMTLRTFGLAPGWGLLSNHPKNTTAIRRCLQSNHQRPVRQTDQIIKLSQEKRTFESELNG